MTFQFGEEPLLSRGREFHAKARQGRLQDGQSPAFLVKAFGCRVMLRLGQVALLGGHAVPGHDGLSASALEPARVPVLLG
jgi:hypothetical protein